MKSKAKKLLLPIFLLIDNILALFIDGISILLILSVILCVIWLILELLMERNGK